MRSILEKAIVHLLNEEHEQAEALFHKFMVGRARQIHESLRQGDDAVLEENWNEEITNEEYFTEDDLGDLEDKGDEDVAGDDDVSGADLPPADGVDGDMDMGDVDSDSDMDTDMGGDDSEFSDDDFGGEDADKSDDERISDLEDQLERLTAEFDSLMGDKDGDMDGDMDDMGDDDMAPSTAPDMDDMANDDAPVGDDMSADIDSDGGDLSMDDEEEPVHESDDMESDEDFDDVTESIVSELEKISVSMDDGKEIAGGKGFEQNRKSNLPNKRANIDDASPVKTKQSTHTGFERETAPAVKDMKKRRNTKSNADDGRSTVSKEGDKGALLNKDFGKGGEANTKSPVGKR